MIPGRCEMLLPRVLPIATRPRLSILLLPEIHQKCCRALIAEQRRLKRAIGPHSGEYLMALTEEKQRAMLRIMQTIRRFEERASDDYRAGDIYGVVHCYIGEEAVATGVCAALNPDDQIISTHRGHGHCIAKGADLKRMMAELYGRETGYCKGKGGSMHIADFSIGMLGANGIVAGGIPIVTGAGLAAQLEGKGRVAVSFFWRWGVKCRSVSRVDQYCCGVEAAHALCLRK